jgi:hypothetical protein
LIRKILLINKGFIGKSFSARIESLRIPTCPSSFLMVLNKQGRKILKIYYHAIVLEKVSPTKKIRQYRYLLASLFLIFFLLSMVVAIRSQEATTETTENQAGDSHSTENPLTVTVINEYFEIIAVFLEAGVVLLLWKTVKDFAELAKVGKLQTEVRFRPWVGPSGGF